MRKIVFALLLLSLAASAQADCWKCYHPPSGYFYCDLWTYNGYATCTTLQGGGCTLTGTCEGPEGDPCRMGSCVQDKWVCSEPLPEKAEWVVATVKIVEPRPLPQRAAKS